MTLYDYVITLVGQPQGEYGPYVVYVMTCFIGLFAIYMLLNLILTLFRLIWGKL